jgi:hypothetical protein
MSIYSIYRQIRLSVRHIFINLYGFIKWWFKKYIYTRISFWVVRWRIRYFELDKQVEIIKRLSRWNRNFNEKKHNETYRKNMEIIVQISEDTGISQHELLSKFDIDKIKLNYHRKSKPT